MKMTADAPAEEEVPWPSVWRDGPGGSHLALLYHSSGTHYFLISSWDGKAIKLSAPDFKFRFDERGRPDINPQQVILNFIGRAHEGLLDLKIREERTLFSMLNKESLMALSERQLANEYVKVMGAGPKKIPSANKEKAIDEMLEKISAKLAKATDEERTAMETGNGAATPKEPKMPRAKKAPKPKKEKVAKPAKAAKTPKAKKEPKPKKEKVAKAPKRAYKPGDENPFRDTSMKHKAFAFYVKNQDREKNIAKMVEIGASASTASSWYNSFKTMHPPAK